MEQGWQLRISGLVQGVGFRPWVWRLANAAELRGEVFNDAGGVLVRLFCQQAQLDVFLGQLRQDMPALARIDAIEVTALQATAPPSEFSIAASQTGAIHTGITPDAATCAECRCDIQDPNNRRHGYAFTNCTNCGPRLTIIWAIPYDRANTSMAAFVMCETCNAEYQDPEDRRFHAQPNACPECGPRLRLVDGTGVSVEGDPITEVARLLVDGKIVAIKGLGGFQLAVDAGNQEAVAGLRARKHRPAKPLALMVADVAMAKTLVTLDAVAQVALESWQAPIVLARRRAGTKDLATGIAPDQSRLGVMLPNTPLHHLLMRAVGRPIVLTSGNLAQEPQVIGNDDALTRLAPIADFWLLHDRGIVNRMDDSVVHSVGETVQVLRRSRGYAPAPLVLHPGFAKAAPVLAMGADTKNTFCLFKNSQAFVSQHMGDMANPEVQRDVRTNLDLYQQVYDFYPEQFAVDLHPGYYSTRLGQELAAHLHKPLRPVQHHHAHVAATLAEHGFAPDCQPVLGVVLDGLGFGDDGQIWGGELLLASFTGYKRVAHFPSVALPGGEKANQQPWRNLVAHLEAAFGPDVFPQLRETHGHLDPFSSLAAKPTDMLVRMIHQGVNAPLASSAGRLFDAIAAALGICFDQLCFEGQAATKLQALAEAAPEETGHYQSTLVDPTNWKPLWTGLLKDTAAGTAPQVIAKRVHNSFAKVVCHWVLTWARAEKVDHVVLSGGVFQNALLQMDVYEHLTTQKMSVLVPEDFPANDGGISLGQAAIIAAKSIT